MVIYQSSCGEFKDNVNSFKLTDLIEQHFREKLHRSVPQSERRSWQNSLQFMERVVSNSGAADDCGVLIEYSLPHTSRRIDFLITGENEQREKNCVIVELKQWEQAWETDMDGVVATVFRGSTPVPTSHPSYQAASYRQFMHDFHEAVYTGDLNVHACGYLHNYTMGDPEPLLQPSYRRYLDRSPLFFRRQEEQLQQYLAVHIGRGRGMEILYEIENGKVRPSRKLADAVGSLFSGNEYFTLLDEQKLLYETVMKKAREGGGKETVIISGGPGTGKSVLSFNLLYGMLKERFHAVLAAPNAAFRDVMKHKLFESGMKRSSKNRDNQFVLDHVLCGSGGFAGVPQHSYDVVIVDEAHRLKDSRAYNYRGEDQIRDVIAAASLTVFFIDDAQRIRPEDIGSVSRIRETAAQLGSAVEQEHVLDVQFRCSGVDGYINWLDYMLQIRDTANFDAASWYDGAFSFRLCTTPWELYEDIAEKSREGYSARLLAGYAWPWTNNGNQHAEVPDVAIPEHGFAMPWNSRSARSLWAVSPEGVNQVGCIHTSQGLEFDYVGVIIGRDLRYHPESMKLYADWDQYKDSAGKKGLKGKPEELLKLIKHIYRTLMSRGMKGCSVYCCDPHTAEYLKSFLPGEGTQSFRRDQDSASTAAEDPS